MTDVIDDKLHRIEVLLSAFSDGLSSEWSTSYVGAYAWASRKNPEGHAFVELYRDYSDRKFRIILHALAGTLERLNLYKAVDCFDAASDSLTWLFNGNCKPCGGTGVVDIHQQQCPFCQGTGKVYKPSSKAASEAFAMIHDALAKMNSQIAGYLRGSVDKPIGDRVYRVNVYAFDSNPIGGRLPDLDCQESGLGVGG